MAKTPSNWHPAQFHIDEFLECAANNNLERAETLLKLFPNDIINSNDHERNTALHIAARNGHLDMVKLLVNHGANLYAENGQNRIAAQEAKNNQRTNMGYLLGYADTKPVQKYLNQMDSSLQAFIKLVEGVAEDKQTRIGRMLVKAPWMVNAKVSDGRIVKDIMAEAKLKQQGSKQIAAMISDFSKVKNLKVLPNSEVADPKRAKKRIARDQDEATLAKTLGIKPSDVAQLIETRAKEIQERREQAAAKGAERMKAAEIKREEELQRKANKPTEMISQRKEKIALEEQARKKKEKERRKIQERAKKAKNTAKKLKDEELKSTILTEDFIKAIEQDKIQRAFAELPLNEAIDIDRAKERIKIDQDDARDALEAAKQAEKRRKAIELENKNKKVFQDKIKFFKDNLGKYLEGEKQLQEEIKTFAAGIQRQPEFASLVNDLSDGYVNNLKSRTSAKVARALFGRKTDKDMLKEAIAEFKKAISQDAPIEIKKIDRWESWRKSKNKMSHLS